MTITIYHNPRCSKSRQTLDLIRQSGQEPKIIAYLEEPLTGGEIEALLKKLKLDDPREAMRRKEEAFSACGLADPNKSREELVRAIAENPILLERPIVISGKRARICRPPERVEDLL